GAGHDAAAAHVARLRGRDPDRAHAARPPWGGGARPGVPLLDAVAGGDERAPRLQRHGARRRGARRGLPGGPRAPELRAPALRVEPGARARVRGRVRRGAPPMRLAPCVMVQGTASGVGKSLERLRAAHDLVVIEGAGSPAEINLECDLANMRVAAVAGAPVLLVGDIDRGGVFAALVGTLALLSPDDRARVAGLVVNRFRGDPSVLAPGLELLAARAGVPVLGVVPHLGEAPLPEEDSLGLEDRGDVADALVSVAVARLPRIANFDDLEPLTAEPRVAVRFVTRPEAVDAADVIVLPGSKTTVADLAWLRERGLAAAIARAATDGRAVIGLCGGYQMLGERRAQAGAADGGGVTPRRRARSALGRRRSRGSLRPPGGSRGRGARPRGAGTARALPARRAGGMIRALAAVALLALASPAHALVLRDMLGREVTL